MICMSQILKEKTGLKAASLWLCFLEELWVS